MRRTFLFKYETDNNAYRGDSSLEETFFPLANRMPHASGFGGNPITISGLTLCVHHTGSPLCPCSCPAALWRRSPRLISAQRGPGGRGGGAGVSLTFATATGYCHGW